MISRRTFVKQCLATAVAAGTLPVIPVDLAAFPLNNSPPLAVRRGEDIGQLVRQTIEALGGIDRFVRPGSTVVLKPNIGWDRRPEYAANTHPLVVKSLAELCLEARAKRVRIFDFTCNDPRRCYVNSGIRDAIRSLGNSLVRLEHINERAWKEVAIENGRELTRWTFYRPALEADHFINIPIAKHHGLSRLTLGMKNIMGVIGDDRGRLHWNLAQALADINSVIQSDLTMIDATRILTANGPQGGNLEDVEHPNTLIASPDIVAADAYAATLFGFQPDQIESVVVGAERGLGTMDLEQVERV